MEHQDKTASEPEPQHETALEEIARETRATSVRTWTVTGVIAAALLTVMYVVTTYHAEEDAAHRSAVNGEMQNQPGEAQQAPGGIPRPGGV
jgi:negative regulator of sigma E activity